MTAQLSRSVFLEKDETGRLFYELFRIYPEQQKKKVEWKKSKKGKPRSKDSRKQKVECMVEVPPEIEVAGNASSFAVFATVRLAVLERWMKETCEHFHVSSSTGEDSEDESAQAQAVVPLPPIPKIVGVGLRSVFELVRESRVNHPVLCTKALSALLDVLQGHQPEALKNEPTQVVEPLLELLLDLATLHAGEDEASMCLTAVACSCLLALVTARGDTGKILSAVAALLMCPRPIANQTIQLPSILSSLQKSVHGVLLGKTTAPDWITHGIPLKSHLFSFTVDRHGVWDKIVEKTCASDGQYLYILTNKGLFKIGTGYGNSVRGYIYSHKKDFFNDKSVWMGFAHGKLLLVVARGGDRQDLMLVDRSSLQVKPLGQLDLPSPSPSLVFSDGDSLAVITPTKEDGFSMWGLSSNLAQLAPVSELPLKLVQKCLVAFGSSSFDDEASMHTINTGTDDEIASIASGKEFSLIRTASGKVLYSGKGSALGLKGCVAGVGRWCELVVAKAPRITQVAVGHDSLHAVLLADDGSAYFTGTARRGEDADHNKVRRQPKAVKPKRMMKVESEVIVYAACNNGTTALVSKEGQLFMFGKDTVHCDPTTGVVNDLKNVHVTQVALGKAHAVVVTNKGHLYSFGINNKGQCGREFVLPMKEVMAMETTVEEEGGEDEEVEETGMCAPGTHKWKQELCMVCTVCRECTGYSISCLSSMRPDRYPGQECGCGEGDSGCSVCGCCRICARENLDNSEMAILGPSGASDIAGMMRLDLIFGGGRQGSRLQDHLQLRLEERKQRQRAKLSAKHSSLKMKTTARSSKTIFTSKVSPNLPVSAPGPSLLAIESAGSSGGGSVANKEILSEFERDASRVSSLPPARVHLPTESPIIQVACGLHHTVCLVQSGEVYTFGSNSSGQLGVGDMGMRGGPVQVKIGLPVTQVAAGSNHTVLLTSNGMVYTFGSSQKKQLGRGGVGDKVRGGWQAAPAPVAWVGPRAGRRAAWVSASSDQTYVSLDEALINSDSLLTTTVMANSTSIILVPREQEKDKDKNFHCLVINKRDGTCTSYKGKDQVDFKSSVTCLDSTYNVIFSIKKGKVSCYCVVASEVNEGDHGWWILSPTLALPCQGGSVVSRSQAALHLLASLDTLASSTSTLHPPTTSVPLPHSHSKVYTRDDFSVVSRFESHGGGWGYSGHSIEAIRFMADTDILLGGFGLFGGRGEYTAKIKLFEIGVDGGEQENDGEVLAETEEIPYECGPRHKYPMLFDEPVHLQANKWYVAWARVSGPSSDCGSSGQGMVTTEDQVVFYFKSSKKSNNGTDVNAGQIPQLLYRVMNQEQQVPVRPIDHSEPFYVLSRQFSTTVTRDGLQSLLALLQWSWNSFKKGFLESTSLKMIQSFDYQVAIQEQERLIYIGKACLRLLRMYSNEIYPSQVPYRKQIVESVPLAECIGDIRALLRQILCDTSSLETVKPSIVNPHKGYVDDIVSECHETFVACYHAFYPTSSLKWTSLCDLLASVNREKGGGVNELLTGMLSALRCRWVRLRSMFPILTPAPAPISSPSQTLPTVPTADLHHYPILVEQMTYRSHVEGGGAGSGWVLRDVVEKLLDIVTIPVKHHLTSVPVLYSHSLVHNASHLLARIIAELATYSTGISDEVEGCYGRVVHTSPSRFTRTNQSRTWNTGNGSPDAICFSVDRPGVVILGVAVYGGVGTYDYELELLDDQSCMSYDSAHVQRWNSLQSTRGSFGPDDCLTDDIAEIKFDYPVLLRENIKYAVRLRNHGGRTSNGDGGLSSVKGPDGVTFSFSTCSLSFNGTTQTRGQIPYIIYYSKPEESESENKGAVEAYARKVTLNMTGTIVSRCSEVLAVTSLRVDTAGRRNGSDLGRRGESSRRVDAPTAYSILAGSEVVLTLLPLVMAHISLLTTSDPRCAVQVLTLLQELLPHVSALNLSHVENHPGDTPALQQPVTHRAWVESDHPYKQATVSHYKVVFPESVQWMSVEFSSDCGTGQAEDSLQLYVPAPTLDAVHRYWPVLRRLSHNPDAWPHSAVILPGNEVVFSLETASDYVKDELANTYGFKCLVTGYEWGRQTGDGLQLLETEIAFLAGMCSASLIKKDLQLPVSSVEETEEELELVEETAKEVYSRHPTLLGKGLALSAPLTITQALDGTLPYSCHSKERLFLRDFVQCVGGTSGGRLARWLQPESYVEPSLCQLLFASDQVRCGWPVTLTLITKDQYDDTVHAPNLKVEIKAVPIDKKEMGGDGRRSVRRSLHQTELDENPIPQIHPSLDVPYEVTHRDKMSYMAITMMKAYESYSFEELRYLCPTVKRCSENMLVKSNNDGTYNAAWTPATVGYYSIITTIDGYNMREGSKVEVKEPPQGVTPPSSVQGAAKKPAVQPSRLRRFVAKNSAGLRIRAHPSLQSEQIGIVHLNGTIAFIDEIENDDGVWLRLSQETIRQYCDAGRSDGEAWCLQYNQHLGKTLLMPIVEPRGSTLSQQLPSKPSPSHRNLLLKKGLVYKVVKCGVSGHNVRKAPSLKAPAVGTLTHGYLVSINDLVVNKDGTWLQLDKDTLNKCLFNWEGDGWCLAMDSTNVYLRPEAEKDSSEAQNQKKKGYNFTSCAWPHEPGSFLPMLPRPTSPTATPFVFGSTSHQAHVNSSKEELRSVLREPPKSPAVSKWLKYDDAHSDKKSTKDGSSDVSVRESSGTNGNGITPPDTPRKTSRSSSPQISSSSPLPIPGSKNANTQDSISSSPLAYYGSSNKSAAHSPAVGGGEGGVRTINRCVKLAHSAESDTSALSVSSLTMDSPQPSSLSSTPSTPRKNTNEQTNLADLEMGLRWQQTGTQTSPPQAADGGGNAPSIAAATFTIPDKPVPPPSPPASQHTKPRACEKEGMSPSMSESLRAIFASFLWHEGLVHDAMACASFLKFHPNLPKQGALVVTRHNTHNRLRTADQRHSVEVSTAGNYLHIKPSTLESLTRSAANANANRQRNKRETPAIPEETRQKSPIREPEKPKDALEKSDPGPKLGDKEQESPLKATTSNESHIVMVLPPALKCLVQLWEQLNQTSLQAFATNSFVMSPSNGKDSKGRPKKRKEWKGALKERVGVCELCGGVYPYPVTYHMRQAHAGCGGHAGGKGYNSGGNFCVGWAGNCGDGGVGGSSWYLVCDSCRDRYLKSKKPQQNAQQRQNKQPQQQQPQRKKGVTAPPIVQVTNKPLTPSPSNSGLGEAHMVMKSNALFLLELSSGDVGVKKRSPPGAEDAAFIRTSGPFQSLAALGANPAALQELHFPMDHALFNSDYCDSVCISFMQESITEQVAADSDADSGKNRSNFHRSVSMGPNGWNKRDEGGPRLSLARKRNNSTCDLPNEGGSLLLWNPSAALQRLVPDQECQVDVLSRPVLAFLLEQHNLPSLRLAMSHALRKATCRVYAMQALDWLVHVVTQPTCLHDLLWWFVVALSPSHSPTPELPDPDAASKDPLPVAHQDHRKDDQEMLCEHPLSDMGLAGDGVHPLPHTFHSLLQSISHLMLLLPPGSSLQQMAVRCWGINFTQQDHMFLHRSHVFSNISKILSRSEEEQEENAITVHDSHISMHSLQGGGGGSYVEALCDLTSSVDIKASSRQAMVGSLTDNSTETFWESGDEDRNKTKSITVTCTQNSTPKMIYVHVDNSRDLANKVSCVTFQSGPNPEELYKIRTVEIESRFTGWISCLVLDKWEGGVLRLELKGGDNSLRVRQIRILGQMDGAPLRVARQLSTQTIQHCNTEAETLRVFRLITSQVFGKLIKGEGGNEETAAGDEETNDLKEHVVGILFSRSKLTHLQKQVCSHIVAAIRKESLAAREEWECRLAGYTEASGGSNQVARSPTASTSSEAVSDTYCFEMLSMVLALSGSSVGRLHLAQQHGLLSDLMGLLHTGSPRVQRQVTALLRRMLPEVTPLMLAHILGVNQLPPTDFTIATTPTKSLVNLNDAKKQGLLDVFLSCIAKALHVQVKTKAGKESKGLVTVTLASSINLGDNVNTRWWLRGNVSRKLAEEIISLIKDMSAGKLSESWARVSKAAIAENIVNLTRLSEDLRTSTECLKSPSLWLALASLCVLEQDHVDRLSSGQWRHNIDGKPPPPRPTCMNHDDGETNAIIQCNVCGSLCAECDRYLHLHRRTRMHHRQVCKEEEEAIRVDLHEGCGRTKLFWALLVADSSTLKALVEFREAGRGVSSKPVGLNPGLCRFCGASGSSGLLSIGNVCPDQECQEHGANACSKVLGCGHLCGGIQDETECLPCLHGCSNDTSLKQDADDMCMICFVDALASAPALQLKCGHVFHLHCCRKVLAKRWAGPRITFSFSQCPICKSRMEHKVLNKLLQPIQELFDDVKRKALMRLEYEGLDRSKPDPAAYAMDRYAYYVCFKCKKAYYGGEARCEAEARSEFDESELVCGACSDVSRAQMCPKHGADFLEYKCRYCCSVAVFFCFGTTHFCNPCHDDFQRVTNIPKNELPSCPAGPKAKQLEGDECPLHVKHPQTGEEFALGCGVCRNAHTF